MCMVTVMGILQRYFTGKSEFYRLSHKRRQVYTFPKGATPENIKGEHVWMVGPEPEPRVRTSELVPHAKVETPQS